MGICSINLVYALVITLGPITYGTVMCYPSPTATQIQEVHGLTSSSISWSFYNAITSLFGIAGPFVVTGLLKILNGSRKITVFIIAVAGAILWLLNLLTKTNIYPGMTIRALLGIVVGAYSSISPMYLNEIAPEGSSGFFGSLQQTGVMIGFVFFDFIGPSLTYMSLNYVGSAICVIQAVLIWFIPESPAISTHQAEKDNAKDKDDAEHEPLCKGKQLCGIITGISMMIFQQFCGINAILTNLADLMNKSGLEIDGSYQAGIASIAQLIALFIGMALMDKLGRKLIWIISTGIIVVFLLIFALNDKYGWSNTLPIICIFLYQLGFGLGMGPIPWFIIAQYFDDPKTRAMATSIVSSSNWVFAFAVILLWPVMKDGMGMFGSLIFFMCVSIVAFIFGFIFIHNPTKKEAAPDDDAPPSSSSSTGTPDAL